jgi:hypothetical protein
VLDLSYSEFNPVHNSFVSSGLFMHRNLYFVQVIHPHLKFIAASVHAEVLAEWATCEVSSCIKFSSLYVQMHGIEFCTIELLNFYSILKVSDEPSRRWMCLLPFA